MAPIKEQELWAQVDKAQLFCRVYGEGKPAIIVIHGGPGMGLGYLLPQMAQLGAFSTAFFYDQRGAGKSVADTNWQANPFDVYVRDINQLREALGLQTITLLGHSWGGLLAAYYAVTYPNHVDKIIYLNSVPLSSADYLEYIKHRTQIVDNKKQQIDALRNSQAFAEGCPKTIEQVYRIHFSSYFAKPEQAEELKMGLDAQASINSFKIYDCFHNDTLKHAFDLYEQLKKLNQQSLIIAGDKDVIPLHYMKHLHDSLTSSQYLAIKDCGHFPYIEQPEILFKTLKDFLNE